MHMACRWILFVAKRWNIRQKKDNGLVANKTTV